MFSRNVMSELAWDNKVFGAFKLQKLSYKQIREISGLTAQMVIRCYSKVANAYKLDKKTKRQFRKHGAIAYDDRILRWYTDKQFVSIWSVGGRLVIPYQAGESDLVYSKHKKAFYLLAVCEISDPTEQKTEDALGVDLGVVNIAVNSDGYAHTSDAIERNRRKIQRLRSDLNAAKNIAYRAVLVIQPIVLDGAIAPETSPRL